MSALFPWLDWTGFAPANLTQSILPGWSFLTVNEGNSSAPDTERRIVAQDSYGRQIGQLMEIVELLLKRAEIADPRLGKDEEVVKFTALKDRIDAIKHEAQKARQDRLIEDLQALKIQDRDRFDTILKTVT